MKRILYILMGAVLFAGAVIGWQHLPVAMAHVETRTVAEVYCNEVTRVQGEAIGDERNRTLARIEQLKSFERRWAAMVAAGEAPPNDSTVIDARGLAVTGADMWLMQSQITARKEVLESEVTRWALPGVMDIIDKPRIRPYEVN